jgi:hypothetical protein
MYECAWRKGHLNYGLRPDLSGVMVEVYPQMVAALLAHGRTIASLPQEMLAAFDDFVRMGKPVVATGQFARLPEGMTAQAAKDILVKTVMENRHGAGHVHD